MNEPSIDATIDEDREERLYRAYVYWMPMDRVSITGEVVYDRYEAESGVLTADDNLPEKVKTISLPIGVWYFHPGGCYGGLQGTYVDQDVERSATATQADGSDSFFLVDLALSYRLPKRHGMISLEVKNLFDKQFMYQDDSYREFRNEPATGPYYPERTAMLQLNLSF